MEYFAQVYIGDSGPIEAPGVYPQPGQAGSIINNALTLFIIIGIIAALIVIVLSGINWIMSSGDKQKLAQAKNRLTWAVGGLALILLSIAIVTLFGDLFGVELMEIPDF